MHGQFIWYELTTTDVGAAKKFYPRFTGWGTQPFDADYTMWTNGGAPFAGLFNLTDEMRAQGIPPNWMPYVEVTSVDDSAALATSLGGKVMHGPMDIPEVGRFAVVQDPQGATLAIYKSATGAEAWNGDPVVGKFSWHELMSTDHVKGFEFYRRLFGWEKVNEMDMGGGAMYVVFGKSGKMYGGMFSMTEEWKAMHPFWLCYIHVKDVPRAVAIARQAGAVVQREPMEIPGGVISILGDPQGAGFALHHVSAPAAAPKAAKKSAAKPAPKAKAKPKQKAAAKAKPKSKPKKAAKRRPAKKASRKPAKKAAKRTKSRAVKRARSKPARRRSGKSKK